MSGFTVDIRRKRWPGPDGAIAVLQDLRLHVAEGEFVCVLGPSGCGKTTLLHIIAGLDTQYDGTLTFEKGSRPRQGVMFQTPRLMPWLGLEANLELVADAASRAAGRPASLLREAGLAGFEAATPGRVSGGMQRRAALARALVNPGALLLLDEPFVSLDAPTAIGLREVLVDVWRRERQTVLCLTHDLREALTLADRLIFLSPRPGTVVLDLPNPVTQPRDIDGVAVAAARAALLERWPELLSGIACRSD